MSNTLTNIKISGKVIDVLHIGSDTIYDVIKNNYTTNGVSDQEIPIEVKISRPGGIKYSSDPIPANQIDGFDSTQFDNEGGGGGGGGGGGEPYFRGRVAGPNNYGTCREPGTRNDTFIQIYSLKNGPGEPFGDYLIEDLYKSTSEFTFSFENAYNVDINSITLVEAELVSRSFIRYRFPKPSLIDPDIQGKVLWTITDTITNKSITKRQIIEPYEGICGSNGDDGGGDDDDGGNVIVGCMNVNDPNYDPQATKHDDSYCTGDFGETTETAESIEKKIEESISNSVNKFVLSKTRINTVGDYELTEKDRFLQYSILDDKGNYSPIVNWVRGGDLQQLDTEIDVLDSIVLKLESSADSSIQRLDTIDLLKTPFSPLEFTVDLSSVEKIPGLDYLQPNFKKEVEDLTISEFSDYENFDNITKVSNTTVQQNIIDFYLQRRQNNITLNTDFTDFTNFVKFSSAEERLMNFYYKVQLLESYTSQSAVITSVNPSSTELTTLSENIRTVKNSFDDYEYYLYNSTGSFYSSSFVSSSEGIEAVWPKETTTQLYHTTSSVIQDWFSSISVIAQDFDSANKDSLRNNTPEYIREDQNSEDYVLFIDMIGQLFDEIWLHTNELNNLYDWNNNIFKGVSQDLSLVLLNMYADNIDSGFTDKDISEYLLGVTSDNTSIGSNLTNYSFDRQQKETQRRLLTNLPHLLKHKGTKRAITSLVNSYGIPESTLFIQEYGSFQSPTGLNNEFQKETYTYKLKFDNAESYLRLQDNSLLNTKAVEFNTQWNLADDTTTDIMTMFNSTTDGKFFVSYVASGSDNLGKVVLTIESGSDSYELSSSFQPIYNGEFWNILVQQVASGSYEIHTNYFNRQTATFEYQTIASGTIPTPVSGVLDDSFNSVDTLIFGYQTANNLGFVGHLDELRVWGTSLSSDNFTEHTKFPYSIKLDNALDIPTKLKVRVDIEDQFRDTFVGSPGSIPNLVFDPSLPTTIESHNFNINDYVGFNRVDFILPTNIGTEQVGNNKVRYNLTQTLNGNTLTPSNQLRNKIFKKRFRVLGDTLNIQYVDGTGKNQTYRAKSKRSGDRPSLIDISLPLYANLSDSKKPLPKTFTVSYIDGTFNVIEGKVIEEKVFSEEYFYATTEKIQQVSDINELTIGFSPTQIFNQIILQHFGSNDLTDNYGNPLEQYSDTYEELSQLIENFFSNISSNQKSKFFIDYIRNFDKSLFNNIKKFVPTKANLTTALFIEPHYLNRSKAPRLAKAQSENQTPSSIGTTTGVTVNPPSDFLTETNDSNPIRTKLSADEVERFIGDFYSIDLKEDGSANTILSKDEIGQFLNQNTVIITVTDGFLENIIQYNPPDNNMVVRIKNDNNEIFLFEFRKYDFTQALQEIEDDIFNINVTERNENNDVYVELVRRYDETFALNNKVFLIKYPYGATKPGIPATFEDLQHQLNQNAITGEGTNEENTFTTGDGQTATGDDSGGLEGGGTTETSTTSVTRTIATEPDASIKLTVF